MLISVQTKMWYSFLFFSLIFSSLASIIHTRSNHHQYFWRDYNGIIPKDAVPAGSKTYIGQAYIHGHGIFVFQIFRESKTYEIPAYGYKKSDKLIKILCSNTKYRFSWMKTSAKTFQVDVIGKNLVIGGYDHVDQNKRMLYVGRVFDKFIHRIGSITGLLQNAYFKYLQDKVEREETEFEVLTFKTRYNYIPKEPYNCDIYDFYWREYDGEIPDDAFETGRNINGDPAYMGQAYIHNHGVYGVQIYPGKTLVDVPCYGWKTTDYNIKILCSNEPKSLKWSTSSVKTYKSDTEGLDVVRGGWDQIGNGFVTIGRVFYQGFVIVGDVTPFKAENLRFPFGKVERTAENYEVLIYRNCTERENEQKHIVDEY